MSRAIEELEAIRDDLWMTEEETLSEAGTGIHNAVSEITQRLAKLEAMKKRIVDALDAKDVVPPDGVNVDSFWVGHSTAVTAIATALADSSPERGTENKEGE